MAMLHLSDVFVVTPSGSLVAPKAVELQLNPDDLATLRERMDLDVIRASLTEVYEEQAAAYEARFAGPGRADVRVIAAGSVPPGRYRLRQADPVSAEAWPDMADAWYSDVAPELACAAPRPAYMGSGSHPWPEHDPGLTVASGMATIMEQSLRVPALRLVTGTSVAETMVSGARAGRGSVEMVLPDVPTVSREQRDSPSATVAGGSRTRAGTGSPLTEPRWRAGSRSATAMRSAGGRGRTRCCLASRSAEVQGCDNCHPRYSGTGRSRRWRAVVREWRLSGDGSAFPVVRSARRLGELSARRDHLAGPALAQRQ